MRARPFAKIGHPPVVACQALGLFFHRGARAAAGDHDGHRLGFGFVRPEFGEHEPVFLEQRLECGIGLRAVGLEVDHQVKWRLGFVDAPAVGFHALGQGLEVKRLERPFFAQLKLKMPDEQFAVFQKHVGLDTAKTV